MTVISVQNAFSIIGLPLELIGFVLPKLHFPYTLYYIRKEVKSASCTTTSLFIVIFSKNSFFIRSFKLRNCLATAFVLKSGCKGSQFYNTKQIFLWKMCSKTYCFRFVLQNRGKYGRFHLLYIHARERNCGRKQGIEKWRKGCIREGKGTIRSKKAMENVKIMQEKEERDGREVRKY